MITVQVETQAGARFEERFATLREATAYAGAMAMDEAVARATAAARASS